MKKDNIRILKYNKNNIFIGKNYLKKISKKIVNKRTIPLNIIIIDSKVYTVHRNYILQCFKKFKKKMIIYNSLEKNKSFDGFEKLANRIFLEQPDRNTRLIFIGGGVLGDLGGLISSTMLRGLKMILIPTTLLSQVDSSIGGKNGINNRFGKNLIGTFYNPQNIFVDTRFLKSLNKREIKSGYAEIFKHSLIKNKKFYQWLENNYEKILQIKEPFISKAIFESIKIKISIVKNDEKEDKNIKNSRALLNFGHTIGHALETKNKYKNDLKHGEAISIGMSCASKISFLLKYLDKNKVLKIENHLNKIGLLKKINKNTLNGLIKYIKKDKKNKNNLIKFILLKDIGSAFISKYYTTRKVENFLSKISL